MERQPFGQALLELITTKKLFLPDIVIRLLFGNAVELHLDTPAYITLKFLIFVFLVLLAFAGIRGCFSLNVPTRRSFRALAVILGAPLIAGLAGSALISGTLFTAQYFLFVLPPALAFAAGAAANEPSRIVRTSLLALGFALFAVCLVQTHRVGSIRPNTADAVNHISANMLPGDVILLQPSPVSSTVAMYIPSPPPIVAVPSAFDPRRYTYEDLYVTLDVERAADITKRLSAADRIWHLKVDTRFDFDPNGYIASWLKDESCLRESIRFTENYPVRGTLDLYHCDQH
jgi:hypothetical protein